MKYLSLFSGKNGEMKYKYIKWIWALSWFGGRNWRIRKRLFDKNGKWIGVELKGFKDEEKVKSR